MSDPSTAASPDPPAVTAARNTVGSGADTHAGAVPDLRIRETDHIVVAARDRVLLRCGRALARLLDRLSEQQLSRLADGATDADVLVAVVEASVHSGGSDPATAPTADPAARRTVLAQRGGSYSAAEVADMLGISRQAVDKRRKAGTLLAVTAGGKGYRYPLLQFRDGAVLPGLPEVLEALAPLAEEWDRFMFLVTRTPLLSNHEPIAALSAGMADAVVEAARVTAGATARNTAGAAARRGAPAP